MHISYYSYCQYQDLGEELCNVGEKAWDFMSYSLSFKSHSCFVLSAGLWESCSIPLSLSFIICEKGIAATIYGMIDIDIRTKV